MFDVLAFVYENFTSADACPEPQHMERKLSAHGFRPDEIQEALAWLDALSLETQGLQRQRQGDADDATVSTCGNDATQMLDASPTSMRVYSASEQAHLGAEGLGFLRFLEQAGPLPAHVREIIVDRAMAASGDALTLPELKVIVLLVHWRCGLEPNALLLDELCDHRRHRVAH